jgi:hypothetical protein
MVKKEYRILVNEPLMTVRHLREFEGAVAAAGP